MSAVDGVLQPIAFISSIIIVTIQFLSPSDRILRQMNHPTPVFTVIITFLTSNLRGSIDIMSLFTCFKEDCDVPGHEGGIGIPTSAPIACDSDHDDHGPDVHHVHAIQVEIPGSDSHGYPAFDGTGSLKGVYVKSDSDKGMYSFKSIACVCFVVCS